MSPRGVLLAKGGRSKGAMEAGYRDRLRLSDEERAVLSSAEFAARAPFSELAGSCGLKESAVRYLVNRLIRRGVILGRSPYLNPCLLGCTNYALYIAMASGSGRDREAFSRFLHDTPAVTWFVEAGGDFQYALTFSARHVGELADLRDSLSDRFSHIISGLTVCTRVALWFFPRKYLAANGPGTARGWFQGGGGDATLDPIDATVLSALSRDRFDSLRALAQRAGIPASTFDRRVRALEEKGVIQGFHYLIDAHAIGFEDFRLLVHSRGMRKDLTDRLVAFSKAHPNVRKLIQCICDWDYELEISVPSAREVRKVVEDLHERFGDDLGRLRVIPLFSDVSGPAFSDGIVRPAIGPPG